MYVCMYVCMPRHNFFLSFILQLLLVTPVVPQRLSMKRSLQMITSPESGTLLCIHTYIHTYIHTCRYCTYTWIHYKHLITCHYCAKYVIRNLYVCNYVTMYVCMYVFRMGLGHDNSRLNAYKRVYDDGNSASSLATTGTVSSNNTGEVSIAYLSYTYIHIILKYIHTCIHIHIYIHICISPYINTYIYTSICCSRIIFT